MGIIVNPRGAGGSGKTTLVRSIMAACGEAAPVRRPGRARPIGYRLRHPAGGPSLAVLGAYEATRGGCDTISRRDGGLEEIFRLAGLWAAEGHDVLLEGSSLGTEQARTAALAAAHPLHVIHLTTSAEDCARALLARHRLGRGVLPRLASEAARRQVEIASACDRLRLGAVEVEHLGPEEALQRIRHLLRLGVMPARPAPDRPPESRRGTPGATMVPDAGWQGDASCPAGPETMRGVHAAPPPG